MARAWNNALARFLSQCTSPSATGTVVEMPLPMPRMASPSWARFHTWSLRSTVIDDDSWVASGTSRNGLSSTDGPVIFCSIAERNARWRSTRPKSDDAVARVRT